MMLQDFDPITTKQEFVREFELLRERFQSSKLYIMNIHHMHPTRTQKNDTRHEYLTHCKNETRQTAYRRMIECAAVKVLPQALFLDVKTLTATPYARQRTKVDGHHYVEHSSVLKEVVRVILHGICHTKNLTGQVQDVVQRNATSSCSIPSYSCHLACRCVSVVRYHTPRCARFRKLRKMVPTYPSPSRCFGKRWDRSLR